MILILAGCGGTPAQREAKYLAQGKDAFQKRNYHSAIVNFEVASQNMPTDAEPLYRLGLAYLKAGDGKQAVDAFLRAVRLNPKHEGAQHEMALMKVGSTKPEVVQEAKDELSLFLKAHPDDVEVMGPLALAEAKLGHQLESAKWLEAVLKQRPENMRPAQIVIGFYAAKGDVETAKQLARHLSEQLPQSPAALVLRAEVSLAARDVADADLQVSRALALKGDFRPALQLRLRRELQNAKPGEAEATAQELSKLSDKSVWSAYGRLLFAENKLDQGIAEYNRLLKEHSDDAVLRNEYAGQLIDKHRNPEAEAVVAGTLQKYPQDKVALLERVKLRIDKGDLDGAAKDAKTLQDMNALSGQLSYEESRIFAARGQLVKQGDLLTDALRRSPRLLAARLALARALTASGQPKGALETLNKATPAEKRTAGYVYNLNLALIAAGNLEEARKGVDAALKVSRSPEFLYEDGLLRVAAKDLPGARHSAEAAFQLAPGDPANLRLLGQVLRAQKEGTTYLRLVKDAAAQHPKSAVLQDALGTQLAAQGDAAGAQAAFEAAKAAGDVVNAEYQIAVIEARGGKREQAEQRLLTLVKTHDNAPSRLLLAEIESVRGASGNAVVAQYLKALELAPSDGRAMNNLANILAGQEKYEDALFWALKALGAEPANPVVQDTVGWIYFNQRNYNAALPYLEKSLKAADRPVAHYHLAGTLAKLGDLRRGKEEYDLALKQDPKSEARGAVGPLFEQKR